MNESIQTRQVTRRHVLAIGVGLGLSGVAAPAEAAAARRSRTSVESWIRRHARTIEIAPDSPAPDLHWLDRVVTGAHVVGLGESTHGSSEQFQVKHRLIRRMVEHHGFRTVAFEDDFASGVLLDRYLTTGQGDPRQLVNSMGSMLLGAEEILDLISWLRTWNQQHHRDKVRFLGTDLLQLRQLSFDEITHYVGTHAPDELNEVATHLRSLQPQDGENQNPFVWYGEMDPAEKEALIATAQRVVTMVSRVAGPDRWQRAHAEQHARTIHGWFVNYAESGFRGYRERFIADSLHWWRRLTGQPKTVYWAANVHTAATRIVTHRTPEDELTGPMAGGVLRARLDDRYVSIGTWFGSGTISSPGWDPAPEPIGPPRTDLLEATLHAAQPANFAIDLRNTPMPRVIRRWLEVTRTMRVILPEYQAGHDGNDYTMTVDGLRDAFDAAIYLPTTTASRTF